MMTSFRLKQVEKAKSLSGRILVFFFADQAIGKTHQAQCNQLRLSNFVTRRHEVFLQLKRLKN